MQYYVHKIMALIISLFGIGIVFFHKKISSFLYKRTFLSLIQTELGTTISILSLGTMCILL